MVTSCFQESAKLEVVHELSRKFGHSLYKFNSTKSMDYSGLQDIFHGMASTSCLICFNNLNHLDPSVLSVLPSWSRQCLRPSGRGRQPCTCRRTIFSWILRGLALLCWIALFPSSGPTLLLYPSVTAVLPDYIMRQFRTISIPNPDLKLSLEVMLFSQGLYFLFDFDFMIPEEEI